MLKPNETKNKLREEANNLILEFRNKGNQITQLDTAVAQGLSAKKYLKKGLRGSVKPLGS